MLHETKQAGSTNLANTHVEVVPLAGTIGAEIRGVDLRDFDDRTFKLIRQAFLDHHVLVFRDQHLTPDQHVAFGKRWGSLHIHPLSPQVENYPTIIVLTNIGKEKVITEVWHSDVTPDVRPPLGSILYARQIPRAGGDTLFANQHAVYERLSDGMKRVLGGLRAVHTRKLWAHRYGPKWLEDEGHVHPAVRTHPDTGRKALFVNQGFTQRFEDMTEEESAPLLQYLYNCACAPDVCYRHMWRRNDLVMWDNRSVQHFAVHDYGDEPRVMHRVTIDGDAPF